MFPRSIPNPALLLIPNPVRLLFGQAVRRPFVQPAADGCRPKTIDLVVKTATFGGSSKGQVTLSILEEL